MTVLISNAVTSDWHDLHKNKFFGDRQQFLRVVVLRPMFQNCWHCGTKAATYSPFYPFTRTGAGGECWGQGNAQGTHWCASADLQKESF